MMNVLFQNPLWLLLPLVAVPLLAHLFSRTRPRTRDFPSLRLLREAMRRVTRVRRPRDRGLLLLRTLAIAALVAAFLQPWLLSRFAGKGNTARTVVIIVDATASMGFADGTRTRLAQATAAAEDVLATLPAGSRANLVWLRAHAESALPEPGPNLDFLRQSLRQASVQAEPGDLAGALALAVKQLAAAEGDRELVICSDFQASAWRKFDVAVPPSIRVTRVAAGAGDAANTGLAGLALEPARPVAGQDARLVCRVRNFSGEPRRVTVFAEAGESRLSQAGEMGVERLAVGGGDGLRMQRELLARFEILVARARAVAEVHFLRREQVEKMHAEAAMKEGIERVKDGGGIVVEIGENDDGAAPAQVETGAAQRGGERGRAARGVVFEGAEDVVQMPARAAGRMKLADAVVEDLQRDAVAAAHHEPRERGGEEGGELQLRQRAATGEGHAFARIEQDVTFQIRLLLEGLHVMPVIARKHAPVHERGVVAGRVGAVFVKLHRGPAQLRAMPPGEPSLRDELRGKLVGFEAADVGGAKVAEAHATDGKNDE